MEDSYISRLPELARRPLPPPGPSPLSAHPARPSPTKRRSHKLSKLPRFSPTSPSPAAQVRQMAPRQPPARMSNRNSTASISAMSTVSSSSTASTSPPAPAQSTVMYGPRPRRKLVSPRKTAAPVSPARLPPHTPVYSNHVPSHHPTLVPSPVYPVVARAAPQAATLESPLELPTPTGFGPAEAQLPTPTGFRAPAAAAAIRGPRPAASAEKPTPRSSPRKPTLRLQTQPSSASSSAAVGSSAFVPARAPSRRPSHRRGPSTRSQHSARQTALPPTVKPSALPKPAGGSPLKNSPVKLRLPLQQTEQQVQQPAPPSLAPPETNDTPAFAPLTPPKTPPPAPSKSQRQVEAAAARDPRPLVIETISVIPRRPAPLDLSALSFGVPPPPPKEGKPIPTPPLSRSHTAEAEAGEWKEGEEGTDASPDTALPLQPGKLRQQLVAELPITLPVSSQAGGLKRGRVHRRPVLKHLPTSLATAATAESLSSYGDTPALERDLEVELGTGREMEVERGEEGLVFAGEYSSGSEEWQSTELEDTSSEVEQGDELWAEVEGLLQPTSGSTLGGVQVTAGLGRDGKRAYVPVFGPALAKALMRPTGSVPTTPSTGGLSASGAGKRDSLGSEGSDGGLHEDVRHVLGVMSWKEDEEWEDEASEEDEEELVLEERTPLQERARRVFNRPTLRRSGRSVRRKGTAKRL